MVLLNTECFGYILSLSIFGVHSMSSLGQVREKFEGSGGISWHEIFDIFLIVIPING